MTRLTRIIGEKVVPIPQEGIISAGHGVAGCLMFGREREQPGIIVEPMPEDAIDPADQMALGRLRNKLWCVAEAVWCSKSLTGGTCAGR